jgi:hypothetical protein
VTKISRRDHRAHTAHGQRRRGIDGAQKAVGNSATHHRSVQQAITLQIIDVLAAAAQKTQVFDAFKRTADTGVAPR